MNFEPIITCAVTGAGDTTGKAVPHGRMTTPVVDAAAGIRGAVVAVVTLGSGVALHTLAKGIAETAAKIVARRVDRSHRIRALAVGGVALVGNALAVIDAGIRITEVRRATGSTAAALRSG